MKHELITSELHGFPPSLFILTTYFRMPKHKVRKHAINRLDLLSYIELAKQPGLDNIDLALGLITNTSCFKHYQTQTVIHKNYGRICLKRLVDYTLARGDEKDKRSLFRGIIVFLLDKAY